MWSIGRCRRWPRASWSPCPPKRSTAWPPAPWTRRPWPGCWRPRVARPGKALTLAIKSADDVLDYVPDLSPLGRRLARRCWPGPVTLVAEDCHPESLVRQLAALGPEGRLPQRHDRPARAGPSDGARHPADAGRPGRADQRQSAGRRRPGDGRGSASRRWANGCNWCSTTVTAAWVSRRPWSRWAATGFEILRPGVVSEQTLRAAVELDDPVRLHRQHVPQSDGRSHVPQDDRRAAGLRAGRAGRPRRDGDVGRHLGDDGCAAQRPRR